MIQKKPSPYDAFLKNIEDAKTLISYAKAFSNKRNRRMRQELRSKVGDALKVPVNQRGNLDCLESDDLFVVLMPGGSLSRNQFSDLQPLLRQAVVAACAALEAYVADKAMEYVGDVVKSRELPARMGEITLTVGHWAEIEQYDRRGWGIRRIIEQHIREQSSTAPNHIGQVLSTVGVKKWAAKVDNARNVEKSTTATELDAITKRRNHIAHGTDKRGRGPASVRIGEVEGQIRTIEEVVEALEKVLGQHPYQST